MTADRMAASTRGLAPAARWFAIFARPVRMPHAGGRALYDPVQAALSLMLSALAVGAAMLTLDRTVSAQVRLLPPV